MYACRCINWCSVCQVSHIAMIHACTIGNECLIGMHSTILDGAEIGEQCIIGAGTLVTKGTRVPNGSLVFGSPARIVRSLSSQERNDIRKWADKYVKVAKAHKDYAASEHNRQ